MRRIVLLAVALMLAGCTDSDWDRVTTFSPAPSAPAQAAASANYAAYVNGTGSRPTADQKCARGARERADDTKGQGFDEDIQKAVYDKTYADCMIWAVRTSEN